MICRKVTIEKVEEKREEMIKLAAIYGFTSLLTVQASQELDALLNALTNKRESEYFSLQKVYRYF
ncbi:Spo0E family sporulation regulatory protein-aspartic acid phosphatase [Peribacillus sp. RS7]|uniref:aspartyl-phosphate phosphatase Spo0E family protein n=1 Tax=unclassified Peribacillus TaxID=2675266 RepID=UPI0025A08BC6|nr:aspartyl-phosphate phosphatase Spo0E family protein [Peribacillus sp. ACCC06369]MDM5357747.1 aspartyl-phosphate phosphatase Spo0E family protein [Peribacillus sp. ACCC06369]